jgi:hypothetical protein
MSSSLTLDDLPLADEGSQGREATVDLNLARASRRDVVSYAVRGATFLGLVGLSLFRAPKRAGAENPPWDEFTQGCGVYGVDPDTCSDNMCVGTTLELMDNAYCTTDCAQVDANNWYQWHKNKRYGHFAYRDYPGNICAAYSGTPRDAWWWNVGACGTCNPAVYRCHDGEKRATVTAEWDFTICEGLARCNGAAPTC